MNTTPSQATWRDRWIWGLLAVLLVIGGWIGFASWRDTNNETDRQTDRIACAIAGDPNC